jgi:glycyl-tRNA synthetase beta chain
MRSRSERHGEAGQVARSAPVTSDDVRPLLIELGCEELPPRSERALACALRDALRNVLEYDTLLGPGEPRVWWTPRRLAVLFPNVRRRAPAKTRRVSGPLRTQAYDAEGQPTPALLGFARAHGLDPAKLVDDGERIVAERVEDGADLVTALSHLYVVLGQLPVSRRMLWEEDLPPFSRPIRSLLLLHGEEVLPVRLGPLRASRETSGHRVHHPDPVAVASALEYPEALKQAFVTPVELAAVDEARAGLAARVAEAASALAPEFPDYAPPFRIEEDPELLDENLGLLEHPAAVAGSFDREYLELPEEVIRVVLRVKQRAFTVHDARGRLVPAFVCAVNLESRDPRRLRAGFERVVRPRLSDALFFFRQDRSRRLEDFGPGLSEVTLEHGLGTLEKRKKRLQKIVTSLTTSDALDSGFDVIGSTERAAQLSQHDLLTALVGEYPELEGIAGGIYARLDGETEEVATALKEYVLPRHAGDRLPQTTAGAILALALRLEILCGSFARGIEPSGQSDPMGLRRAASGLLQILLSGVIDGNLDRLFERGLDAHDVGVERHAELVKRLYDFHLERLSSILGARSDLFEAVANATLRPVSPREFRERLDALKTFVEENASDAARLIGLNKRILNILRPAGSLPTEAVPMPDDEPEPSKKLEIEMSKALETYRSFFAGQRGVTGVYRGFFKDLLSMSDPLDRFFTEVLVMDPDDSRRRYRLWLLHKLSNLMRSIAALEHVQVPGTPP